MLWLLVLKGELKAGVKFLNAIQICSLTANLGDSRTIVIHPSFTTHAKRSEEEKLKVDITPELIRVSVGLEHVNNVIEDIDQALNSSKA